MSTDNPSAFPQPTIYHADGSVEVGEDGMSLHTWQWTRFCERAMQEHLRATLSAASTGASYEDTQSLIMAIPKAAIKIADQMMAAIAEREQGGRDG